MTTPFRRPVIKLPMIAFLLFLPLLSGQAPLSGHYPFSWGWLFNGGSTVPTNLARAVLGNIDPPSFLYGPRCAQPALPWPGAIIFQYNPWAWLVRSYYYMACSCSRYNMCCDWLIVGHYSSVMPTKQNAKQKAKSRIISNLLTSNVPSLRDQNNIPVEVLNIKATSPLKMLDNFLID